MTYIHRDSRSLQRGHLAEIERIRRVEEDADTTDEQFYRIEKKIDNLDTKINSLVTKTYIAIGSLFLTMFMAGIDIYIRLS